MCEFRPCIDLHEGKVKQIVGLTLNDGDNKASENFVSSKDSAEYAEMYKKDGLLGGHVIKLGPNNEDAAVKALKQYPNGLQVGGGINLNNAMKYLRAGASHVIVTSFIFSNGTLNLEKLGEISKLVGKSKLVLDLSCRRKKKDSEYFVVTDRWQTYTNFKVNSITLKFLANYCAEFLIHGVEVEGQRCGVLEDLIQILSTSPIPIT